MRYCRVSSTLIVAFLPCSSGTRMVWISTNQTGPGALAHRHSRSRSYLQLPLRLHHCNPSSGALVGMPSSEYPHPLLRLHQRLMHAPCLSWREAVSIAMVATRYQPGRGARFGDRDGQSMWCGSLRIFPLPALPPPRTAVSSCIEGVRIPVRSCRRLSSVCLVPSLVGGQVLQRMHINGPVDSSSPGGSGTCKGCLYVSALAPPSIFSHATVVHELAR